MGQLPGTLSYSPFITLYTGAIDPLTGMPPLVPLDVRDTISQFSLAVDSALYTLPGFPFDASTTPNVKRLEVVSALSGQVSALIGPPDYAQDPVPTRGDFRGILLFNVGDFGIVEWDSQGLLWRLVEVGGPTAAVATLSQSVI